MAVPLLSIEQSILGHRWLMRPFEERLARTLSQKLQQPEIIGRLLSARQVPLEEAEAFLMPRLRLSLPDPYDLLDMKKAVDRTAQAIQNKEKIAIFGDYDVDGATSSALLKCYFHALGIDVEVYIPDRQKEGYGPNQPAFRFLKEKGASLIVTVDCGTTAFEALEYAKSIGQSVIVLDHHIAGAKLPAAAAIVNPNRVDESSPYKYLAAVGVSFLYVVALNRYLRSQGFFHNRPEPDLFSLLDLVALGTVCDVMPLVGLNRVFVSQGLKIMKQRQRIGLAVLMDLVSLKQEPNAYHLGFMIGPRINAGGRVGCAFYGMRLLSTTDCVEAQDLALKLDDLNRQRQEIESSVLEEGLRQVDLKRPPRCVVVHGDGWHPGVIGIVAGRIKEKVNRPTFALSFEGEIGKGSGRSVTNLDLGALVHQAVHANILEAGGGHAMAAGLSLSRDNLPVFKEFCEAYCLKAGFDYDTLADYYVDAVLTVQGASLEILNKIASLEPFGSGNPAPRFLFRNVSIRYAQVVGRNNPEQGNHILCEMVDSQQPSSVLKGIAFRASGFPLGEALLSSKRPLHIVGTLKVNYWNGYESVQLQIEDAAFA